jgi:hypothetical protein
VLGIEATGVVAAAPGGEFEQGQQVAAMMGGMGRTFDGGYAEFTNVPASQVILFRSELDWATLGEAQLFRLSDGDGSLHARRLVAVDRTVELVLAGLEVRGDGGGAILANRAADLLNAVSLDPDRVVDG